MLFLIERKMFDSLKPKKYFDSIFDIDFEKLYEEGFKGIIFDLDNTIVPWNKDELDARTAVLLERLKSLGFKILIMSNNCSHKRIIYFSEIINLPAMGSAFKPRPRAFKKALEILDIYPETTLVIGDRILTDIWGGNRLGMYTILVSPLNENEVWIKRWTVRKIENLLIKVWLMRGEIIKGEKNGSC
ncbi:MAG TPA: YqeG family HAD IIIA-type phosphatase [Dictyoglomaceae bacterium]|nr:YqeG family HAD IIIA-type phosphatase [Dictyoglomaceae bacterium]